MILYIRLIFKRLFLKVGAHYRGWSIRALWVDDPWVKWVLKKLRKCKNLEKKNTSNKAISHKTLLWYLNTVTNISLKFDVLFLSYLDNRQTNRLKLFYRWSISGDKLISKFCKYYIFSKYLSETENTLLLSKKIILWNVNFITIVKNRV